MKNKYFVKVCFYIKNSLFDCFRWQIELSFIFKSHAQVQTRDGYVKDQGFKLSSNMQFII